MNQKTAEFIESLEDTINEAVRYCFAVRSTRLQMEWALRIDELASTVSTLNEEMQECSEEDSANALLSVEMGLRALSHELRMWVSLKTEKVREAWEYFVSAERNAANAVSIHPVSAKLLGYLERLRRIEKVVFPTQLFNSVGMIVIDSHCSICKLPYEECDHEKGKAYMGKYCSEIITNVDLREVSIVEEPRDKRCRVFTMTENGIEIDTLTLDVVSPSYDHPTATIHD
jgi:hypothetical protein